jgi:hypothetical protein
MLWNRKDGFSGQLPTDQVYGAIQAAIRFAALDANDFSENDDNRAFYLVTAENAELFLQPVDEASGSIAHRQGGSLKSTLSIGYKIGQEAISLPAATMPILRPFPIFQRLTQAVYDM